VLAKRLEAKKFHLLAWGHGGWVQLFSLTEVKTLADLKKVKLYTSASDDKMMRWYTSNGFNPMALDAANIPQQMTTGALQAAPMPPFGVVAFQLARTVKYMLDLNVGPLIGALIITDSSWNKVAPEDREKLLPATKALEKRLQTEIPQQDAKAVVDMQKLGLKITKLDAKGVADFHAEADKLVGTMRGNMVPADVYDAAMQAREEYRKSHK